MAKLKPWYQVVTPREDLRENRPLDASEFAVHLDHIRDKRAHEDYLNPERFFERTYLTKSLLDLSSQVVRRISGMKVDTSAVFNMATQFGGGKTHSLTALYHLAKGGEAARGWNGVSEILKRAGVSTIPKSNVAVFVGTEFDVIEGRGGDGEPLRKTPWGEIAWQLGGETSFNAVAKHDDQGIAPSGDVIRKMLPKSPSLILMDELLNYVNRGRSRGLSDQLYNFVHNLSEEARAQDRLALCVSIPMSELEMNPADQRDFDSYKKLLDRVGKAISMSADAEVMEIIRRRLFEWHGLPDEAKKTAAAYAEWAREHSQELSGLGDDTAVESFQACYPFHPSVISVFERKWQSLPGFQRTRGVLRLLALWVARAYQEEHRKASSEPLISLGSAPFEDQTFRDAVFVQLGSDQLVIPVTTDIAGKKDAHAKKLDKEATEAIRKSRLHQKVATAIFMESNGGQSQAKADASLPEIRAAIGAPDMNLADVETALEGLVGSCYYLTWDRNRYRFGLSPNLNQMLVTRRGAVLPKAIEARIAETTVELFKAGPKLLERRCFPERSNDIPDRPQLTLVVLGLDKTIGEPGTKTFMETLLKESGTSGRTFKSSLLFAVPASASTIGEAARNLLAWEDIQNDQDSVKRLEESQKLTLTQSLGRAKTDFKEAVWRAYRHVFLLGKNNSLKETDLGQINSSMATTLPDLIINTLVKDDEITESVGASRLVRYWPPALVEWSTKSVRDAFFASPALPRLLQPDSIKRTIADGVTSKLLGYARKDGNQLKLERFGESLSESEVEIGDDVYILKAEDARKLIEPPHLAEMTIIPDRVEIGPNQRVGFTLKGFDQYGQSIAVDSVSWDSQGCSIDKNGQATVADALGLFTVIARSGPIQAEAQIRVVAESSPIGSKTGIEEKKPRPIQWSGYVPCQKWTNFYTKVVSRFATDPSLTLRVSLDVAVDSERLKSQLDEVKSALRELGLDENATSS